MAKQTYNFVVDAAGDRRRFRALDDAERFARRQCEQAGKSCLIQSLMDGSNGRDIAVVSRDALDRVWTDIVHYQGSFL
jgi:ribosomal protein S7